MWLSDENAFGQVIELIQIVAHQIEAQLTRNADDFPNLFVRFERRCAQQDAIVNALNLREFYAPPHYLDRLGNGVIPEFAERVWSHLNRERVAGLRHQQLRSAGHSSNNTASARDIFA